jgi:uncharacterized protein YwgA
MKKDYVRLLAAMKYLKLEMDPPSLDKATRMFIQKFAYILKKTGFDFSDYNDYNFYLNGMYSPNLTQDYYQIGSEEQHITGRTFQQNEINSLERYKQFIQEHSFFQSNKLEFHEAITTLLYLNQQNPDYSERDLINKAKELKNHLSLKIVKISLNVIKQLQFTPDLIAEEIAEEFELWDSLNDG